MAELDPRINPEPEPTCRACGYDLRGSVSARCSECSSPIGVRLAYYSVDEFERARELLALHGLLLESKVELGKVEGLSAMGRPINYTGIGLCFASLERWREACDVLEPEGLIEFDDEPARPIVDRSEPLCPACGEHVEPSGPGRCSRCGTAFIWIELESLGGEAEGDEVAVQKPSLASLVEDAVGPLSPSRTLLLTFLATALVLLLPVSTIGLLFTTLRGDDEFAGVAILLFGAMAVGAAIAAGMLQWLRRGASK